MSYLDNAYGMRDLQQMLLDMMLELDRICRKHNIEYTLLGGVPALMLTAGAFASGLKVLRSHPSCALRILVVFQLVFWVQMQIEPYLFIDSSLFNFLFFLTTGYIVEESRALPPLFAKKRS